MDEKRFWDIIGFTCQPDQDSEQWEEPLLEQLMKLDPEEIVRFGRWFDEKTDALSTQDLWRASSLINRITSEDAFFSFQNWVVGMGREVYEATLNHPDSLAGVVDPARELHIAELHDIPKSAWECLGLEEAEFYTQYRALGKPQWRKKPGGNPDGARHEIRRRLPRLAALYLSEEP